MTHIELKVVKVVDQVELILGKSQEIDVPTNICQFKYFMEEVGAKALYRH
jgi:hypothetical protein